MNFRFLRFFGGLLLLVSSEGCHQYATEDIGYSIGTPIVENVPLKRWSNVSFRSPYKSNTWFGSLCTSDIEVWCDGNGNWSVTNIVSNRSVPHSYSMRVEFGHQNNDDPTTFTPFASYVLLPIKCEANEAKSLHAAGAADSAIRSNFAEINAIRPIFVLEDSGVVVGFSSP